MTLSHQKIEMASYSYLASEYYNPDLHPTCANFREMSVGFIFDFLKEIERSLDFPVDIIETGAGLSVFSSNEYSSYIDKSNLTVQDLSEEMLSHSRKIFNERINYICSDARSIEASDNSFDLVVSCLADPYNDETFWNEIKRIIRPGGFWVMTAPTRDWASKFRPGSKNDFAEFLNSQGERIFVPSLTYDPSELIIRLRERGARLMSYKAIDKHFTSYPISPKIEFIENPPIIDGFAFRFED